MFNDMHFPNPADNLWKNLKFEPQFPQYEDGESPYELMKSQSDYLKNTVPALEELARNSAIQAKSASEIANSSKLQADSAKEIADSSKVQSKIAVKKANKADVKGWIAVGISLLSLIWNIVSDLVF